MSKLSLVSDDYINNRLQAERIVEGIRNTFSNSSSIILMIKNILEGKGTFSDSDNEVVKMLDEASDELKNALKVHLEVDTDTIADGIEKSPDLTMFSDTLVDKINIILDQASPKIYYKSILALLKINGYEVINSDNDKDHFTIDFAAPNGYPYRLIYRYSDGKDFDITSLSEPDEYTIDYLKNYINNSSLPKEKLEEFINECLDSLPVTDRIVISGSLDTFDKLDSFKNKSNIILQLIKAIKALENEVNVRCNHG